MSSATAVEAAAGALAAGAAVMLLWRGQTRRELGIGDLGIGEPGQAGNSLDEHTESHPAVRLAFRWLAVVAVLWGAAFIAQESFGGPLGGAAIPLTLADLLALLALPALVIGVASLASMGAEEPASRGRLGRYGLPAIGPGIGRSAVARLADGCLLAAALFSVGWVAVFGRVYTQADVGAGTFALVLVNPAADLITLAVVLPLALRAGRRSLAPVLALIAMCVGDCLDVGARTSGVLPTAWARAAWIAGLCLLAAAPFDLPGQRMAARYRPSGRGVTTFAAALTAGVAGLVIFGWTAAGGQPAQPVLVITLTIAVLALVARVAGLLRRASAASAVSQEADRQFRELADRTSDVVLVCHLDGIISYASPAVAHYGYAPEKLDGVELSELVHPEDRAATQRAALAATISTATTSAVTISTATTGTRSAGTASSGAADQAGRISCRVRSADGTWRHVESTISIYRQPGAPERLLVTARDVSDQVALRRQLAHLTFHDGLTGLPNRAYLEERAKDLLNAAARPAAGAPAEVGAIFLDLDGFTAVNDSVGHGAGDLGLAQAARRLRAAVPSHDIVARWGGDEFAVLIENAASAQAIVDIAERLAGVIAAEPFRVADRDISLTASVGVALADESGPEHLLRNADVAMSRAKESGGGRVEVFAAHMHADVVRRLELATDLREAITQGRLGLEYQPVVELATSRVTAVEALVRWPRGGELIPPAEFLGVAEDSGLIVPLGNWVLREACEQVARWRAGGWMVGLSVNFSPRQVSASQFTQTVLTALQDSGLPPGTLTLEVTERVLIDGAEPMIAGLAELRSLGIRLAIDDFGTGYASLAYLRQLPVDIIKIDPSFVAGLGTDATLDMLTRTIVGVGRDLGIEVVAEGIERPEQLKMLRAMGCGLGQGYLVARPMTASAIETLAGPAGAAGPPADPAPSGPVSEASAVL
jgi:diguanylate cyclase (GGDEF)-like protein